MKKIKLLLSHKNLHFYQDENNINLDAKRSIDIG